MDAGYVVLRFIERNLVIRFAREDLNETQSHVTAFEVGANEKWHPLLFSIKSD